jgi:hypothetical protein
MAALPLMWKAGEGYDIHVLRGGPASKSLAGALNLPAGSLPFSLKFSPQIGGIPSLFGLSVNQSTGEVTASPPPSNTSQAVINNFLMTVSIEDNNAKKYETEIRVHIHDSVTDIWLTPSTLTIHKGADECRFTVLASFNDGTVGDITDWPQLSYRSVVPLTSLASTDVLVSPKGVLQAVTPGKGANIIVTLQLPPGSVPTTFSAAAMAHAKPSWDTVSANAKVNFVVAGLRLKKEKKDKPQKGGTVEPNKDDPNSAKRDSVASVVAKALNVLFVSEGFSRESDFNNLVNKIVEDLRTQDYLQPFKLVQDSINYWSVFLPSQGDGITLLGEYVVSANTRPTPSWRGNFLRQPKKPAGSATTWTLEELIHEVGLPVSSDPTTLNSIKDLWTLRYGNKDYQTLAARHFTAWRRMAGQPTSWRSVLNERDTAFGMRNSDRTRASPSFGEVMLGSDPRRTGDANIFKFIAGLNYGTDPDDDSTHNLGATWKEGAKDAGFVCFLCLTQKHSGIRWGSYFLSSTGRSSTIDLKLTNTARGTSTMDIATPPVSMWDQTLLPTVVAHEFAHALGLADEYGDGGGRRLEIDHQEPNLLDKRIITTTAPGPPPRISSTVYNKTQEIKWLWPRLTKAGVLNGTPQKSGTGLRVPLQNDHGKPFAFGDIVRFRATPVKVRPSLDPLTMFAPGLSFIVTSHDNNSVNVALGHPGGVIVDVNLPIPASSDPRGWGDIFLSLFKPGLKCALICPRRAPGPGGGVELKLVSEIIRSHIAISNAPLNAPPGNETAGRETAACVAAGGVGSGRMTPTNLPPGFVPPFAVAGAPSDIIGIYEGGGGHDCGVFRPAGRCKMREAFAQGVPFCHVCRYILVDRVDPTKHGELDAIYNLQYPK